MEAIRRFSEKQYSDGLESWSFVKLKRKVPLFTSPFGDVFFKARDGIWFLDTVGGSLKLICKTEADLLSLLSTATGQGEYLMLELALAAEQAGVVVQSNEVFDFSVPPAVGAPLDVDNVSASDFVVKLNIAGQIHRQLRKLPPGTKIAGFSID
jgi:hypothetical protein